MNKMLRVLAVSAVVLMSGVGVAQAATGDVIDVEVQNDTYTGHGPILTNGYDRYQYSLSSATGESNKGLLYYGADGTMKVAFLSYTTNASTAIGISTGTSSSLQDQPYAALFDGYMTGTPGIDNSISLSNLEANKEWKLVVYSQASTNIDAALTINSTQVTNNPLSNQTTLVEGVNYAIIDGLTTDSTGTLSFTYQGQINGFQIKELGDAVPVPEPASVMLLGVGGLLFGLRRNRKKAVA